MGATLQRSAGLIPDYRDDTASPPGQGFSWSTHRNASLGERPDTPARASPCAGCALGFRRTSSRSDPASPPGAARSGPRSPSSLAPCSGPVPALGCVTDEKRGVPAPLFCRLLRRVGAYAFALRLRLNFDHHFRAGRCARLRLRHAFHSM